MVKLSVVIPTHRKTALLRRTLQTLLWQRERDIEILVCNDAGDPGAEHLIEGLDAVAAAGIAIRHIWATPEGAEPRGAAATRNAGIAEATADRILFLDDDCLCPGDVTRVHADFGAQPVIVVGFRRHLNADQTANLTWHQLRQIALVPAAKEARASDRCMAEIARYQRSESLLVYKYLWSCHISYPVDLLRQAGGFWENMKGSGHEDCELGLRVLRLGARWVALEATGSLAVVHQDHPKCRLQNEHAARNKRLLHQTIAATKLVRH